MNYGTTRKQQRAAIEQLKAAGMIASEVATGNHYLWVRCAAAFPNGPQQTGRVAVPNVPAFIEKFAAEQAWWTPARIAEYEAAEAAAAAMEFPRGEFPPQAAA